MEIQDLMALTTPEAIALELEKIIQREGLGYSATHSIFNRGALAGMEATLVALSVSMKGKKKLKKPSKKRSRV